MTADALVSERSGVGINSTSLIALRAQVLQARKGISGYVSQPGGFVVRRRGNGQDSAESKVYGEGDDLRHVDRGATARTGVLHIRTYQEERDKVTILVADFRPSMLWGIRRAFQSVAAAEALAMIGWQALEDGGRVGLLAITSGKNTVIPVRGRVKGMLDVIGGLVEAHAMALNQVKEEIFEPALDVSLNGLKRIAPNGAEVVIASGMDAKGENFDELLRDLARHRYPQLLVVEDRAIWDVPSGYYPLEMADGTRVNSFVSGRNKGLENAPEEIKLIPSYQIDAGAPLADLIRQVGANYG